ncbi:MAG: hypothetical protein GPJ54_08115 [Candidatus Heimdallarchaeota archaeon]|nr:hypothetical protein [Candidatus Heimdallarchaeota archaeon]
MTIETNGFMSHLKKFFFDIYKSKQTYKNLVFSLTLFPIGILAYIYVFTGFITSVALFVVLLGIPLNYYFLRSLRNYVLFIALVSNKITGQPEEVNSDFKIPEWGFFQNYAFLIRQQSTWIYLIYLLAIFWISTGFFILTFGFLMIAIVLRVEPVYELVFNKRLNEDISIQWTLPEFLQSYEILILSILGSIIMTFQLHLLNFFVKSHSKLISKLNTL